MEYEKRVPWESSLHGNHWMQVEVRTTPLSLASYRGCFPATWVKATTLPYKTLAYSTVPCWDTLQLSLKYEDQPRNAEKNILGSAIGILLHTNTLPLSYTCPGPMEWTHPWEPGQQKVVELDHLCLNPLNSYSLWDLEPLTWLLQTPISSPEHRHNTSYSSYTFSSCRLGINYAK